jgi:hypothetical protein
MRGCQMPKVLFAFHGLVVLALRERCHLESRAHYRLVKELNFHHPSAHVLIMSFGRFHL